MISDHTDVLFGKFKSFNYRLNSFVKNVERFKLFLIENKAVLSGSLVLQVMLGTIYV